MKTPILLLLAVMISIGAYAQTEEQQLAQEVTNPVAPMISVPLQNNYDINIGPAGGSRYTLNLQPVLPVQLGPRFNLINRLIVPVVSQHDVAGKSGSQFGMGDVLYSAFFSPKHAPFTFGIGPIIAFPTAANGIGAGEFAVGPTMVAMFKSSRKGINFGILANSLFANSYTSSLFNPFFSKATRTGASVGLSFNFNEEWRSSKFSGDAGLSYSKLRKWGNQRLNLGGGPRVFFGNPRGRPQWGLRATLTLLYPKK